MGKLSELNLAFDKFDDVYHPSENVTVKVKFQKKDNNDMKEIKVIFRGLAQTTDRAHEDEKTDTIEYFKKEFVIWKEGNNSKFPIGEHCISVSYQLPPDLPSSFDSKHGRVRYTCTAKIVKGFNSKKCKKEFTVVPVVEAKGNGHLRDPVLARVEKDLHFLWATTGKIWAGLMLPKTFYIPGEEIPVFVAVKATAPWKIKKTKLQIVMKTKCYAQRIEMKETKVLAEDDKNRVVPSPTENWIRIPMIVPYGPPNDLGGNCKIICNHYYVELRIVPQKPRSEFKVRLPLVMGSTKSVESSAEKECRPPPGVFSDPEALRRNSVVSYATGRVWDSLSNEPH